MAAVMETRLLQAQAEAMAPIDALSAKIIKAEEDRRDRERTIQQLEKTVTSIQPTVNEINRLLRGFGFRSFYLEAMEGNLYRLCRPDGSDAQDTLSEGERNFITFLYFFHLLKGSTSEAGLNEDRVTVRHFGGNLEKIVVGEGGILPVCSRCSSSASLHNEPVPVSNADLEKVVRASGLANLIPIFVTI
jgi:hypothetical protein